MQKISNNKPHLSSQKIIKVQYENVFYKKLSSLCESITGEDILSLVPEDELIVLYLVRPNPIVVEPENGHQIPPEIIDLAKKAIKDSIENSVITLGKAKIPFADYLDYGFALCTLVGRMRKKNHESSEKICNLLGEYFGHHNIINQNLHKKLVKSVFPNLISQNNNFCVGYYAYRFDQYKQNNIVYIKRYNPRMTHVVINNNSRPAYRIGWTHNNFNFTWTNLSSDQLGLKSGIKRVIPVYIQKHALQRLEERLDCLPASLFQTNIYKSLSDCKIIHEKTGYLIEYRINNVKVGYLSALLIDWKLVIRTFLFLSCTDTPEGRRLERLLGLQKQDTSYMKMDKLSTFMSSKLSTNQAIRSFFEKAQCAHMLNLYWKLKTISNIDIDQSPLEILMGYVDTDAKNKHRYTMRNPDLPIQEDTHWKKIIDEENDMKLVARIRRKSRRFVAFLISHLRQVWKKNMNQFRLRNRRLNTPGVC